MSAAEVAARSTAAASVLADYKRELATAPLSRPPGRIWMLRLADVLDNLLYAMGKPGAAVAPGGSATLQPPEVTTVLGALHDAAAHHGQQIGRCRACAPGRTCAQHAASAAAMAAYRALARSLGDDRD